LKSWCQPDRPPETDRDPEDTGGQFSVALMVEQTLEEKIL
jgi:hypothetical protein